MSGIAGCVVTTPAPWIAGVVGAMGESIAHRGPDDHGILLWDGRGSVHAGRTLPTDGTAAVGLAHRRLSIIDLSEAGWQPMGTADGRYHIVCNGAIYNYIELREELLKRGHRFRGESDTEVLLAACVEWGTGAFPRLVGMFAFALLDTAEHRLLLARDFMGIKPLYYATWPGGLAFASEIKALLKVPAVSSRGNPQSLFDYLRYGLTDHGAETMFADVRRFPAAHFAWIDLDRPDTSWSPTRYWTLEETDSGLRHRSLDSAAEELRDIFLDNVRLHMRSDVPVGAMLSGGIDSSSVIAAMRAAGGDSLDLQALGYVADDPRISEERWIDTAAAATGARVHKVTITPDGLLHDLDKVIRAHDEPFGSAGIYAQYCVFRTAAERSLKAVLGGQAADGLLAGDVSLWAYRWAGHIRAGNLWRAAQLVRRLAPSGSALTLKLMLRALAALAPDWLLPTLMSAAGRQAVPPWIDGSWFGHRRVDMRFYLLRSCQRRDFRHVRRAGLLNFTTPRLLRYEDRSAMAHSVENRLPFLTPRLMEFAERLPEWFFIDDDGTTKKLFRQAMRGVTANTILDRQDKIGFEPPQAKWLIAIDPWVRETLSPGAASRLPCLNSREMIHYWENTGTRQRRIDWMLWRWLNAIAWADLYDVAYS